MTQRKSPGNPTPTVTDRDRERCDEARVSLAKYKREGVLGINPATGKLERMPKKDEAFPIQAKADQVEILCEGIH